jgi:hypothetical protein
MIIERPRRRGYQLHAPDSPEAEALLSERASPAPTWTAPLPSLRAPRASRSGASSASTMTACSAAAGRAGIPTPVPNHSSRCSGSRSWSCSAACPGAAPQSSSRTARCRTDLSDASLLTPPPELRARRRCLFAVLRASMTRLGASFHPSQPSPLDSLLSDPFFDLFFVGQPGRRLTRAGARDICSQAMEPTRRTRSVCSAQAALRLVAA